MSKKHFTALAALVSNAGYLDDVTRAKLVNDLVSFCADANPRFSPSRFRDACEPCDALRALDRARAAWARTSHQLELDVPA